VRCRRSACFDTFNSLAVAFAFFAPLPLLIVRERKAVRVYTIFYGFCSKCSSLVPRGDPLDPPLPLAAVAASSYYLLEGIRLSRARLAARALEGKWDEPLQSGFPAAPIRACAFLAGFPSLRLLSEYLHGRESLKPCEAANSPQFVWSLRASNNKPL